MQSICQAELKICYLWTQYDGLLNHLGRLSRMATTILYQPQQVQGIRMIRLRIEQHSVNFRGFI
ncbi:MAG: hypothetical protein A2Z44_09045 [Betaproteobacteria bacterium RBG_19FT_COMBO_58_11]|nr:MAG: hypothetical protein A2Z44_09045 [Betaproteobacteria bacterium RBG_19FT_COMBO_58_11]